MSGEGGGIYQFYTETGKYKKVRIILPRYETKPASAMI
jgi:hypothetical protein